MKYSSVKQMVNGHTAAMVNGRRVVYKPEQWTKIVNSQWGNDMSRIEMIARNGDATVQVKGQVIKVTRDEYAAEGVKFSPTERDAAIIRAAQYKLNYGDV